MALMSAQDFLKSKGSPSSPSSAPKGLMSAKDFMIKEQQPVTDAFMQSEKTFGTPNLNPSFPAQPTYPTSVQGPVPIHPIQPSKPVPLLAKIQSEIYDHTLGPATNFLQRAASSAVNAFTFNQANKFAANNQASAPSFVNPIVQQALKPASGFADKAADTLGGFYGMAAIPGLGLGGDIAGKGLAKILPNAPKILSNLAKGLGAGATYGSLDQGVDAAAGGKASALDRAKNIGENALMFGGAEAGLPLAGKLAKYTGTKIGSVIKSYFESNKPAEAQSSQTLALPPASAESVARYNKLNGNVLPPNLEPIYGHGDIHTPEPLGLPQGNYKAPTRLKVMGKEDSFLSVIPKVIAQATERMTPPLENENELAKWVQGHLNDAGHDVSLNEVRTLSYEDLRQLAEEIKPKLNTANIARKTAQDMGYGQIYDQTTPTLKDQLAKDVQSQVYGVPAPKVDIKRPDSFNIQHVSDAAMPETKIGFDRKQPSFTQIKNDVPKKLDSTIPAKTNPIETPAEDPIQTKEPRVRDKIVNFFDEAEQAARDRLKAKRNTFSSNPIDQYTDYAIIGASKLAKGTIKFSEWSAHMVQDFGEEIKPHLKAIFDRSKANIKDAERQASGVAHLPGVNSGVDPLNGDKVDIQSLEGAIENSANWKDKNRLLLNRETAERNNEDVMGKDAKIMNKTYIEPIQQAAADRQRFITQERSDIKDLGIKYKSPEDALVQKYGEGKMTEEELKLASPQNWQKVKTAAETMRGKYDKYLSVANKVLVRNGYPEIPKRKDYFPHYEEIDGLMKKLGFGFEDNTLPADLNGITANLKPGKNFFTHALQRKGTETTLGAMAGHDRYIEGISKIIHQTDNIKRLRGLDKTLREKHEGTTHLADFLANLTDYTNILAGKKTEMDRSLEAATGRNIYSAVDWLKRRVGANMIGGSMSSALTNTIPVTQLLASTSKASVLKGLASALKNINGNDAIGQESNFLTRRFTSNKLAMGPIDKAQHVAGVLFKGIDHFTSNVVMRAKYYENIDKKGMPEAEALKEADKYATRMMADRSEGSMPTLFHSRTFGLITQFQLEVNNQISHLFKDMPKSMSKTKYAGAIAQVFIYDYLYNQVYEKITGNRPAFDPVGVASQAVQDFANPRLSKGKASGNLVGNIANNLPFASIATGGRIPLGSALPNVFGANGLIKGNANLGSELLKPAKSLALPFGGSQINKTVTGLMAVNKGGVTSKDAKGNEIMKYPIEKSTPNYLRGALFGKNALPETNNFYNNNNPSLTANETKFLESSKNPKKDYAMILKTKEISGLQSQITKLGGEKIPLDEKKKQYDKLVERLKKVSR